MKGFSRATIAALLVSFLFVAADASATILYKDPGGSGGGGGDCEGAFAQCQDGCSRLPDGTNEQSYIKFMCNSRCYGAYYACLYDNITH